MAMRAAQTAATSPSAARAGTAMATGSGPSSTIVATGLPRPSPPPIRSRRATCAARYSARPPHRPTAGMVPSELSTSETGQVERESGSGGPDRTCNQVANRQP